MAVIVVEMTAWKRLLAQRCSGSLSRRALSTYLHSAEERLKLDRERIERRRELFCTPHSPRLRDPHEDWADHDRTADGSEQWSTAENSAILRFC